VKRLLTSCFGLGWLPLAPGTWGSLPPAVIFTVLCWFGTSSTVILVVMGGLVLTGAVVCVWFAPEVIAATGKPDPREVVADELAGQALTFLVAPLLITSSASNKQTWIVAGLGFLLFRVFDITKPWPIRKLEKLPLGWGVLSDDLLAGLYAAVGLILCARLWVRP